MQHIFTHYFLSQNSLIDPVGGARYEKNASAPDTNISRGYEI